MKVLTDRMANYFATRVEAARDSLTDLNLNKYADEVCVMLPKSPEEFERFTYWTEAMLSTFSAWARLVEVRQKYDAKDLETAHRSLATLAGDSREVLNRFQARERGCK